MFWNFQGKATKLGTCRRDSMSCGIKRRKFGHNEDVFKKYAG